MKNIVLFCAAGMSTSLLVTKMKAAANEQGFECTIAAYSFAEAAEKGKDADVILLGPQVRYNLSEIQKMYPEKISYVIDMMQYGKMDGAAVIKEVRKKIES